MPKTSSKTKSRAATKSSDGAAIAILVGTRKGAFIIHGDKTRRNWKHPVGIHIGSIVHHMVMDPRDRRTILMTSHTGHLGPTIFQSTDLGKTWKEATKPPAFPKAPEGQKGLSVHHNFWLTPGHKSEPRVWYVGTSPAGLFRSEDDGMTWDQVTGFNNHPKYNPPPREDETPPDGQTLHSIMIDPRDPKHIYIGLSSGASGVFETKDQGKDWIPLNKGFSGLDTYGIPPDSETGQEPHCMRIHPVNPDRLYQQSHMGVYRMDRAEGVWKRVGENLPKEHGISDYSFPIALHPRDPDTVWLFPLDGGFPLGRLTPDGMPATYITRNGGKTWKRQDKGLPKGDGWFSLKRQAMTTDSRDPVGVYFGTTGGEVWASRDEGESWTQIANSLPEIYSVEVAEFAR